MKLSYSQAQRAFLKLCGGQVQRPSRQLWLILPFFLPCAAWAHSFTQTYTLPVPFSMYAWGSSAALALSFVIVALFAGTPSLRRVPAAGWSAQPAANPAAARPSFGVGPAIGIALLTLSICTGLFGTQNPFSNFNMTFFWVVFVLGVPYMTMFLGDFYAALNPWQALVRWCEAVGKISFAGVVRYPKGLAYYPALLLYMIFIWLELFGHLAPRGLSLALLFYTFITIGGAWMFGYRAWFRYGEFFGVFLRLIGHMAPLTRSTDASGQPSGKWRWRMPFVGLMEEKTEHISLLLFILFMLSSTAYDGLHETLPWVNAFWGSVYPQVQPLLSDVPRVAYAKALKLNGLWQSFWLIASPFVYLAVLLVFVAATKAITKSRYGIRELSLRFALSLIPIAFVYHFTHYYAMLLSQGGQLVRLVSDPFGFGWNLFGTARLPIQPFMIDVGIIWQTQVAVIVIGHIVSGYLAHLEALRIFPTPRQATASQLPLLFLMVLFTTMGLKILSLPLGPAR